MRARAATLWIAQGAGCTFVHPLDRRCARWLLQTHDRVHGDESELTQEFLPHMLGVRRAAVNEVAGRLQQAGLIRYARRHIGLVTAPARRRRPAPATT